MKSILTALAAAFIASSAMVGAARAEVVTGVISSFDQVTGTIRFEDGRTFAVSRTGDDNAANLITPIPSGTPVKLILGAANAVTEIYPQGMNFGLGMFARNNDMVVDDMGTDDTMTSSPY